MERPVAITSRAVSEAEYLRLEAGSQTRHEFRHGQVIDMAGGTLDHANIAANIVHQLKSRLKGKPCIVVGSDLRVKISRSAHYCYPDVTVVCGLPIFDPPEKQLDLVNPQLIIEVSYPSTETDDRGEKFYDYMSLDSLAEYFIVAQDKIRVDTFYRQTDGIWAIGPSATSADAAVTFRSLGVSVPVAEIYAGVNAASARLRA